MITEIREYSEGLGVHIDEKDISGEKRIVLRAYNEVTKQGADQ